MMKLDKELFLSNLKYLTSHGCEPELTIRLKNQQTVFIVAYEDFLDLSIGDNRDMTIEKPEDIFHYIHFEDIVEIEGEGIDFTFPVQSQSILVDGELWFSVLPPKEKIIRYEKLFFLFRCLTLVCFFSLFAFLVVNLKALDATKMIVLLFGAVAVVVLFAVALLLRRNSIVSKYYGKVSDEDREKAKELLRQIHVVEQNEYDFHSIFHFDTEDLSIPLILKDLAKSKKIPIHLYHPIKCIEKEIRNNSESDIYGDKEMNAFVFALVDLLERNLYHI